MKIVTDKVPIEEIRDMSKKMFGLLTKAVVDIEKEIMVVDASMHADEEKYLIDEGSKQENLWGINLYPDNSEDEFIEFDSMINIRPSVKNFSRDIENKEIRRKIISIVNKLVIR